jgi:hypothetical protein
MLVLLAVALVVFAGVPPTPSAAEPFRLVTDQWVPYENLSDATAPGFSTEVPATRSSRPSTTTSAPATVTSRAGRAARRHQRLARARPYRDD